jgi:chromosome segregation ATPase
MFTVAPLMLGVPPAGTSTNWVNPLDMMPCPLGVAIARTHPDVVKAEARLRNGRSDPFSKPSSRPAWAVEHPIRSIEERLVGKAVTLERLVPAAEALLRDVRSKIGAYEALIAWDLDSAQSLLESTRWERNLVRVDGALKFVLGLCTGALGYRLLGAAAVAYGCKDVLRGGSIDEQIARGEGALREIGAQLKAYREQKKAVNGQVDALMFEERDRERVYPAIRADLKGIIPAELARRLVDLCRCALRIATIEEEVRMLAGLKDLAAEIEEHLDSAVRQLTEAASMARSAAQESLQELEDLVRATVAKNPDSVGGKLLWKEVLGRIERALGPAVAGALSP